MNNQKDFQFQRFPPWNNQSNLLLESYSKKFRFMAKNIAFTYKCFIGMVPRFNDYGWNFAGKAKPLLTLL